MLSAPHLCVLVQAFAICDRLCSATRSTGTASARPASPAQTSVWEDLRREVCYFRLAGVNTSGQIALAAWVFLAPCTARDAKSREEAGVCHPLCVGVTWVAIALWV